MSGLTKHKVSPFKTWFIDFLSWAKYSILSLSKRWFAAAAVEINGLKAELLKAKKEATEQAAAELSLVKTEHEKHEARVDEVQQELKDAITKCEDLEQKNKDQATKLANIKTEIQEAWSETRCTEEELRQVKQIANGKQYLLQSVFGGHRFVLLTRVWRSACAFAELP
jgi:chromosome segregation ATPase